VFSAGPDGELFPEGGRYSNLIKLQAQNITSIKLDGQELKIVVSGAACHIQITTYMDIKDIQNQWLLIFVTSSAPIAQDKNRRAFMFRLYAILYCTIAAKMLVFNLSETETGAVHRLK